MRQHRRHVIALSVVALVGLAEPLLAAAQSGVLIGVLDGRAHPDDPDEEGMPGPSYRTIWITHDAAGARQAAAVRSLVVPRSDGFWTLGITRVCERDDEGMNDSDRDVLWLVPVGVRPVITQGRQCVRRKAPTPFMTGSQLQANGYPTYCGYEHQTIEFVSGDLVALAGMSGQSEGCEPRGSHWNETGTVRRLGAIDRPIAFDAVGGPEAPRAYERAMRAAGKALRDSDFNCEDLTDDPNAYINRTGWSIRRRAGAWRPRLRVQEGTVATCVFEHEIQLRLPERITGPDTLAMPWETVLAAVPDAADAFSSPAGDMVVVVTEGQLQVFELTGQAFGRRLLTVKAAEPVMIQWALGPNVARWSKAVERIAGQALPAPRIRTRRVQK